MKFFFIFIVTLHLENNYAKEVSIMTTSEREIIIHGVDCKQLEKSENDILDWTEKVENHRPVHNNCVCKDAICSINVTNSVPLFAQKWQGLPSKTLSGNCWNTMLRISEILPSTRMTFPEELRFFLNSPTICKKRPVTEPNQSGDLVLIRDSKEIEDGYPIELHGFVYINDELAFQKPGPGAGEPIGVTESRYAFENITNPICKKVDGNPPTDPQVAKTCHRYANVYTCSSIKEVLKTRNDQISTPTKKELKKIDVIECNIQNMNNSAFSTVNNNSLDSIKSSLEVIIRWAEDHSLNPKNEADEFVVNYILNRTKSSLGHIDEARGLISSARINGKEGNELDKEVEAKERYIAQWYEKKKKEIDIGYLLLDFTNKYKRLPMDNTDSTPEEETLLLQLKEISQFSLLQDDPEQFEMYLNPEVLQFLIDNKK